MRHIGSLHPAVIAVYFLCVAGMAAFCMDPLLLGISLFGGIALAVARCGMRSFHSHVGMFILFLILLFVNPLFSHSGQTVLLVVNDIPVTLEALIYGAVAAGMILSVLYWMRCFSFLMTSDKLLCVLGLLSPKAALVLCTALRYVPLFRRRAEKVHLSQRALGLYREESLPDRIRAKTRELNILITWVLEGGIVTADSMAARGWGSGKRNWISPWHFTVRDGILLGLILLFTGITVISAGSGAIGWSFYPVVLPPEMSPERISGVAAYGLLCLIPMLLEGEEVLLWKKFERKM